MATVTRGDDIRFPVTLKKDGLVFEIDNDATISANFVDKTNGFKMLATAVPVTRFATGSDWANSLIIIEVDSATSADLVPGLAYLEVQVDDAVLTDGKLTWKIPITIEADVIP